LQHTIGNQALLRMLQTHTEEPDVGLTATASSRFGHNLSQIPLHPPAGPIQAKLATDNSEEEQKGIDVPEEMEEMSGASAQGASAIQRPEPKDARKHQRLHMINVERV
jgi:hypothetical protein